jgi:hypothetical protein
MEHGTNIEWEFLAENAKISTTVAAMIGGAAPFCLLPRGAMT